MDKKKNPLFAFARKEHEFVARYSRLHPHFRRNVFMDALISSVLVIVLFGEINHVSEYKRVDNLLRVGGVSMAADELVSYVKHENIAAYWLGPLSGYKYTIICTNRQEIIVSYVPQGVSLNHPDRFNLTVETYSRTLQSETQTMSNLSSDRDDFITSNGTVITTFTDRPQLVKYKLPGSDKYVEVQYPSDKRRYDMYKTGDRLKLISES